MHRRKLWAAACTLAAGMLCACAGRPSLTSDQQRAVAIAREVERIARARALWPGYEPLSIPLAIYTGSQTLLFRHPAPPDGFVPLGSLQPPAHAYEGRYPAVTSNTSVDIGGTVTATLMADGERADRPVTESAAVALHEAFHVDQRARHPSWQGNEGALLLYPTEDPRLLALRRLESEALRRALASSDAEAAKCWTVRALVYRNQRFTAMDAEFPAYERATELNEGLASYIQEVAAGRSTVAIPAEEYAPAEVRWRSYTIGPALAFLLDRFRPGWQRELDTNDQRQLDELLALAVGGAEALTIPAADGACAFAPAEVEHIEQVAHVDAAAVLQKRAERLVWFRELPGWRVVIEGADGQPLWPQGFDPLNVELVDGGLLHTRFCSLANDAGKLEAMDDQGADLVSMTQGVGPHPLFNGVSRVMIAGLAEKPEVAASSDGGTTLKAPGLTAEFPRATVQEAGQEVVVRLDGGR